MKNKFTNAVRMFAFVPFMAMPSTVLTTTLNLEMEIPETVVTVEEISLDEKKAAAIDEYFKDRSMPLYGTGMTFVKTANKYSLDWTLLPAIAVRESSGGKAKCGFNPFGWGSCKLSNFSSYEDAIETVGRNLGGENPRTAKYYKDATSKQKLYHYNGTVVPTYPDEVIAIMKKIEGYYK